MIKYYRLKKHYTQEYIARLLGISVRYYADIEKYKKTPNVYLALELAKILETSPFILFPDNRDKSYSEHNQTVL